MTQVLPLSLFLGSVNAGKAIVYSVLNLDRTQYAAFALATESAVPGTYYVAGGYSAPDAGGYLVVSESDGGDPAVLTAMAEVDIEPVSSLVAIKAAVDAIKLITDTLDVTAVTQVPASSAGHLTITAGLTFEESVTGLTIPADWTRAVWTLKRSVLEPDAAALIQLETTDPADEADGLKRLNSSGTFPTGITAASATLTVDQVAGSITIYLVDEVTILLLKSQGLGWDVKLWDGSDNTVGRRGTADVVLTETHAI